MFYFIKLIILIPAWKLENQLHYYQDKYGSFSCYIKTKEWIFKNRFNSYTVLFNLDYEGSFPKKGTHHFIIQKKTSNPKDESKVQRTPKGKQPIQQTYCSSVKKHHSGHFETDSKTWLWKWDVKNQTLET